MWSNSVTLNEFSVHLRISLFLSSVYTFKTQLFTSDHSWGGCLWNPVNFNQRVKQECALRGWNDLSRDADRTQAIGAIFSNSWQCKYNVCEIFPLYYGLIKVVLNSCFVPCHCLEGVVSISCNIFWCTTQRISFDKFQWRIRIVLFHYDFASFPRLSLPLLEEFLQITPY